MAKKRRKPPELKVVFETSVLSNKSAYYLLREEVVKIIQQNSSHDDLAITWVLPEYVKLERRHQMISIGLGYLPTIQKLERLLGHKLGITEQTITHQIEDAIDKQIRDFELIELQLDIDGVDWKNVTLDAVNRQPPFSTGETEKGFRDALILEAFIQLVESSPKTPRICRIGIVTNDNLLISAIEKRTSESKNIRVLENIEELRGLINTLVSAVEEEYIEEIKGKASDYFYDSSNEDSLYIKEEISRRIRELYSREIFSVPEGADSVETVQALIYAPQFTHKVKRRIFWTTRVEYELQAYKYIPSIPQSTTHQFRISSTGSDTDVITPSPSFTFQTPLITGTTRGTHSSSWSSSGLVSGSTMGYSGNKILVSEGNIAFDVKWSVSVSEVLKKLSSPKIEELELVEKEWNE